jgi:hypothetical protein
MKANEETGGPINYTVRQFCKAYPIGKTTLYKYWANGCGPEYFMLGNERRIPAEAARSWRPNQENEDDLHPAQG